MNLHKTADISRADFDAGIKQVLALGPDGPGFCNAPYVGLAVCALPGGHDGEHVTQGATGRLVGWTR